MLRLDGSGKIWLPVGICYLWCCKIVCALLQLGSAHKWYSPGWASLHPCSRLYAQHNRSPLWVCRLFPIKPLGLLGPRPRLPFLPLLLPLLLELGRGGLLDRPSLMILAWLRLFGSFDSGFLETFVSLLWWVVPPCIHHSWYSCLVVAHCWSSLGSMNNCDECYPLVN